MSGLTGSITLPRVVAAIIVLALNAYVLTGGADFGGGVWDLLATGPRRVEQRALIASAIGPIWEANHVWLIVVIVIFFTAFPSAFAMVSIVLHIPLALMVIGVVLRGSAFVFRSYGQRGGRGERWWGRAFSIASTITPIFLGIVIGAVSTGTVGQSAAAVMGTTHGVAPPPGAITESFTALYIAPWFAPFPIAVGAMALGLFALVAAVYLVVEARTDALREDFRRRAIGAAGVVFVATFAALAVARKEAPGMAAALTGGPWALALHVGTGLAAVVVLWALWRRHFGLARIAVMGQISLILWGWAIAQLPWLVRSSLTIEEAAAPRITLQLLLVGLAVGGAILVPSLTILFRTFSVRREA